MTQDLREAVEAQIAEWRDKAQTIEGNLMIRENEDLAAGVACGMNISADDLEELLQEHQE